MANLNIDTRNANEKVIFYQQINLTIPPGDSNGIIETNISTQILIDGYWEDFSAYPGIRLPIGAASFNYFNLSSLPQFWMVGRSDGKIAWKATNFGTATKTLKTTVWAYVDIDGLTQISSINYARASYLTLDSRQSMYRVISVLQGSVPAKTSDTTIAHSLGYVPIVKLWSEINTGADTGYAPVRDFSAGGSNTIVRAIIDSAQLIWKLETSSAFPPPASTTRPAFKYRFYQNAYS